MTILKAWCLVAGLVLAASAVSPGLAAGEVTLDCKSAGKLAATPGIADKSPSVTGVIEVVENMADVKPPMLVGCPGKVRVLCMPKTAPTAAPGDKVTISGKIDGAGDNYVTVQPCTVTPAK